MVESSREERSSAMGPVSTSHPSPPVELAPGCRVGFNHGVVAEQGQSW